MTERICHILVYRLYEGDAVSQHTFDLARIVAELGMRPAIFSSYGLGELPADIRPIARTMDYAGYTGGADLTILQYPLWFPLAERFRNIAGAGIFWYHGVTPPELWPEEDGRDLLETAQVRTDLAHDAHLAVAASPFAAAELQRHSGYPAELVRVVPLGIDVERFTRSPHPALLTNLRRKWRLEGQRVLLYVGRVAGNKRLDLLIDALALLAPAHPDLHLLIVGDTQDGVVTQELAASLRRRAVEQGLARRVTFTGRVADVASYYALAHVYVQASQHEGFGAPLVEAMAAGVPVAASADGAMPWLLTGGGAPEEAAGLLFASGDAADLARAVGRALVAPGLRETLIARGRRRAQEFSTAAFRVRAAAVICAAVESAKHTPSPAAAMSLGHEFARIKTPFRSHLPTHDQYGTALCLHELSAAADIALREVGVEGRLGRGEAALRAAATSHIKEAYFDRMVERQVNFNRRLTGVLQRLEGDLAGLEARSGAADSPRPGAGAPRARA